MEQELTVEELIALVNLSLIHIFLPPTVEQVNHFTDRVIQENPSAVIRPPILAG